ncbi:MAG: GH25 family lysozyme, partial [Limisphaerales bacterium]
MKTISTEILSFTRRFIHLRKPLSWLLADAAILTAQSDSALDNGTVRKRTTRGIVALAALVLALGAGQAMAARPLGIDVSRWQGTINWTSVKGAGYTYAWSQATRGAYLVNANFTANMSNGKAAGVLMGAYHFAFPATNSPSTEADYFWATAGPYILADGKTIMPMLDIEEFNGYVGASSYSDWANQWYNNVKAKAAAVGVTIKPVLYSSASFMCNFNSSCSGFGSWVANYNGQDPQTGTPWSCCTSCNFWGGGAWNFWQYSSTGSVPGISGNVDLDVFNGTSVSAWVATTQAAPVISGVSAVNISSGGATITWSTDINSDSVVDYGLTTSYGTTVSNGTMVVSHSVNLSGLSASTTYHYRVKSKNGSGQLSTSGDFTFTTLASGQVADIIIDNNSATVVGTWSTGTGSTDKYGADYRYKSQGTGSSYLQYT